jgi:malonate transporter and related proteins
MSNLLFAANIVAPVFIIVFLGTFLRRRGIVSEHFNSLTSKVVFNVAMPALLFKELSNFPISEIINPLQMIFVITAVFIMFLLAWFISTLLCHNGQDQGAFIQGAFRGNFAIIGFAFVRNAYGEQALGGAAIILAIIMPIYNILSIIALTAPLRREKAFSVWLLLKSIATNPLIIALAAALPFSIFRIPLNSIVSQSINYVAALTLPLALIGIGSSLSFKSIHENQKLSIAAVLFKIVIMPALCTTAAIFLGFRGEELGILYFMFAAPTAIASYIMAAAMGSNAKLAGDIVLVSTIASIFTISVGIYILKAAGLF